MGAFHPVPSGRRSPTANSIPQQIYLPVGSPLHKSVLRVSEIAPSGSGQTMKYGAVSRKPWVFNRLVTPGTVNTTGYYNHYSAGSHLTLLGTVAAGLGTLVPPDCGNGEHSR